MIMEIKRLRVDTVLDRLTGLMLGNLVTIASCRVDGSIRVLLRSRLSGIVHYIGKRK